MSKVAHPARDAEAGPSHIGCPDRLAVTAHAAHGREPAAASATDHPATDGAPSENQPVGAPAAVGGCRPLDLPEGRDPNRQAHYYRARPHRGLLMQPPAGQL